jgi:hypothetical protein
MNAIMERWIQSCRHELLDRTLIWNQAHLLHALREYERHYNAHRPHRGILNARPCTRCPTRSRTRPNSPGSTYGDTTASAASSTNTDRQPELHGRGYRHPQGSFLATISIKSSSFPQVAGQFRPQIFSNFGLVIA